MVTTQYINYRGNSLSLLIAKLYNRVLLNPIRPVLDPLLHFNQNGFRQNRTTVGQILALRRLIESIQQNNLTAVHYDIIDRAKMMKIKTAYGILQRIVQAVNVMYCNKRAKVVGPDGDTEQSMLPA